VPDPLLAVIFSLAAGVSLAASWLLVTTLERVGARLGLSEALLGMLAALAADAPEVTAAVAALAQNQRQVGAGVVIGSNVFNLAALLGLAAVIAGRILLHRRVIELAGAVALCICAVTVATATHAIDPLLGLLLALAVMSPYLVVLGVRHERLARLRMPLAWRWWLLAAITEEELELEVAIHPARGRTRDAALAFAGLLVVIGASTAMERAAVELGTRHAAPGILVGALVLAAVTSLPNAVAAVYLAARGRGSATFSTALNSNAFNVLFGLLLPVVFVGLRAPSPQTSFVVASYAALTALSLLLAYLGRGLGRGTGLAIIAAYLAYVGVLIAISA
jgi:cation:H+ antiporter